MTSRKDDDEPFHSTGPSSHSEYSTSPRSLRRKPLKGTEKRSNNSRSPRDRWRRMPTQLAAESGSSSFDTLSDHQRSSLDSSIGSLQSVEPLPREPRRGKRDSADPSLFRTGEESGSSRKDFGKMDRNSAKVTNVSGEEQGAVGHDGIGRHSSHSQLERWENDNSTHSATSNSSVRRLRDSFESQPFLQQVPPAFRAVAPPSPRGKTISTILDNDSISNKGGGRRGVLPPAPRPSGASTVVLDPPPLVDHVTEAESSVRNSRRPPTGRTSMTTTPTPGNTGPPLLPRSRDSPMARRRSSDRSQSEMYQDSGTSALKVNLIDLDPSYGDKSNASTYNNFLQSIVNSERPETQRGLDVLATMEQNGVTPDDTTWKLINLCSQLQEDEEEHDDIIDSERKMRTVPFGPDGEVGSKSQRQPLQKFALYSSTKAISNADGGYTTKPSRFFQEQDLALMPPAFRSSILAMLRRKGYTGPLSNYDTSPRKSSLSLPKKPPPLSKREAFGPDAAGIKITTSVADRKKRFALKEYKADGHDEPRKASLDLVASKVASNEEDKFAKLFKDHGVVKYMRPDGHGEAARVRAHSTDGNRDEDASSDAAGFEESLESLDASAGPSVYLTLLSTLARSDFVNKANLAGKVLKKMKDNSVGVDENTRLLLAECLRIREPPHDPKPHELDIEEVVDDDELHNNDGTQLVKKKVRFAEKNSFRYIRRRRSIGSNERWDDPLTPPKRLTVPVDLAPGRFSSGLRDDRPSLPRRSNSMSSLLSASSHSARSSRSSSSSETVDSLFDEEPPISNRFKLPFADSPDDNNRKRSVIKQNTPEGSRPPLGVSAGGKPQKDLPPRERRSPDMPVAPKRSNSNDELLIMSPAKKILSPTQEYELKSPLASIPPPPAVDDPNVYRTPSPKERTIKRRRSISSIERRSIYPLTPPRRVSAPLDIFIAQESLKAEAKFKIIAEEMEERQLLSQQLKVPEILSPMKAMTLADIKFGDQASDDAIWIEAQPKKVSSAEKPPLSRNSSRDSFREDTKKPGAAPNVGRKIKAANKAQPDRSNPPIHAEPVQTHGDANRSTSLMVRHSEKVSEHWKRVELREKMQMKGLVDESDSEDAEEIQWSTFKVDPSAEKETPGRSLASGSFHDRSAGPSPRKSTRGSRRISLFTETSPASRPKTKPAEAPSWQRILQSTPRGVAARQGVGNSSDHGTRTAFSRRKEESLQGANEKIREKSIDSKKGKATRRSSLPG